MVIETANTVLSTRMVELLVIAPIHHLTASNTDLKCAVGDSFPNSAHQQEDEILLNGRDDHIENQQNMHDSNQTI